MKINIFWIVSFSCLIIAVFLFLCSQYYEVEEKEVKCEDSNGNEIIGIKCLQQDNAYYNLSIIFLMFSGMSASFYYILKMGNDNLDYQYI